MDLHQRNEKFIELQNLLNSKVCPDDIDDRFKTFFSEHKELIEKSESVLYPSLDRKIASVHDCFISNFSEKKINNQYKTQFTIPSSVYENNDYVGSVDIHFEIISNQKLREISNKEIFDLIIDDQNHKLSMIYHTNPSTYHTGPNSNLVSLVHDYMSLKVDYSPLKPYISQHKKVSI